MRRYLPIFLSVAAILVVIGAIFAFLNLRAQKQGEAGEEVAPQISQDLRPFTTLSPGSTGTCVGGSPDGSWLKLSVSDIKFPALEYIVLYQTEEGVGQGVPSSLIDLQGETTLSRDILLGSESKGRCKYDKGVEQGSLTIKFRTVEGKFLGKLETDWNLQTKDTTLTSVDGKFKLTARTVPTGFFLTTNTFGLPAFAPGEIIGGPYGVFGSKTTQVSGTVEIEGEGTIYVWDGNSWEKLADGKTSTLGIFIKVKE